MSNNKKESTSFMYGAIILLVANIIVKVVGAIFKIPLARILEEEGMGYFSTAYQVYTWLFIVATAGIPVAISKMVSESRTQNRINEIKNIYSVSIKLLIFIGVFGFAVLFFGADFIAGTLLKNPGAAPGIKAVSPALLFVSLMSTYRGYFQGHQNMVPTALSEIFEALGKLIIGFSAAYILMSKGKEISAAGAVFGVSCGALMGFLILIFIYRRHKSRPQKINGMSVESEPKSALLKRLIKIAIPITIGASVFSLTSLIDTAMIMRRLQAGGLSADEANFYWGSYSGYAFPLFNLAPTLINAITISIVPAIASAYYKKDFAGVSHTTAKSLKLTVLFSLPCTIGMAMLAKPILALVYDNTNATTTLTILSCATVFVSLVLVTNAILQSTGNEMVPVRNMIVGGIIKVIINYFLVANPKININGAPIGTTSCYVVILVLNIISIYRRLWIKLPVTELLIKPLAASAVMGVVLWFVAPVFENMGKLISAVTPIGIAGVVYLLGLVAVKGIQEDDLELLPKSNFFIRVCKKLKIVR